MNYSNRESSKSHYWRVYRTSNNETVKVNAAKKILQAWYERSLEAAKKNRRSHPDFQEFCAAILADAKKSFSGPVQKKLIKTYGRRKGKIQSGGSYWVD
jgi:hypothetical protein